uniref:Uncharacterized protein n=1 Tax=Trieres chinensis TaxID=1514140 RepID=A0A7S1ZMQ7_TRICV
MQLAATSNAGPPSPMNTPPPTPLRKPTPVRPPPPPPPPRGPMMPDNLDSASVKSSGDGTEKRGDDDSNDVQKLAALLEASELRRASLLEDLEAERRKTAIRFGKMMEALRGMASADDASSVSSSVASSARRGGVG